MAEGTSQVCSNEDRYVSRMNLRHEKLLKKQLDVLEHERNMKTKSLQADKRTFEERIHRLNMDPSGRAHLSKDTNKMIPAEKKKELNRLLKSLMHRPYETRAGYSYIEYLAKNMQPLVNRPLQWGINPPLTPRREGLSQSEPKKKSDTKAAQVFLTQIEGQTMSFSQRASIPHKARVRKGVFLPPIVNSTKVTQRNTPLPSCAKGKLSPNSKPINESSMDKSPHNLKESSKPGHQRRKSQQKKPPQHKPHEKSGSPKEGALGEKQPVAMATLKVPSPTFHSFIDIPQAEEMEENLDEAGYGTQQISNGSYRGLHYTISIRAHLRDRRKSI